MKTMPLPQVIQGGMGAGVSGWRLAKAVSSAGQLGVVAGTALDLIMTRLLQLGDPGGHIRRALQHFPLPQISKRILDLFFIPGGKAKNKAFKALPLFKTCSSTSRDELIIAANFVEVFLAKEGHKGIVGINYLEKIQAPTLPSLFGAMLAKVDFVLMGAGIPRAIPGILDQLADLQAVQLPLDVQGAAPGEKYYLHLDPKAFLPENHPKLERPFFLVIASSALVAKVMAKKASGTIDGLILEGPSAGGHNAPPRGNLELNAKGEPIFGKRDIPDLSSIAKLGLPFWLAGSFGSKAQLAEAKRQGAAGVQVGTAFAFCEESGIAPNLKKRAIAKIQNSTAEVLTDARASPTGFPFKVFQLEESLTDPEIFEQRHKICDLGYLRHAYKKPDGSLGWRCPGEPVDLFLKKGGTQEEALGRKCVCNGLMANIGLAQIQRNGDEEAPFLTSGKDLSVVSELLTKHGGSYRATDVINLLLSPSLAV
jgi:nitronate monooxygenase